MRDWLDAIPNLGVPGVPGVQPQKTAICSGTPSLSTGVPGVPEHLDGTPGTPRGTPRPAPKSLNDIQEHREHQEHLKNGSLALGEWRTGLNRLPLAPPLHGLSKGRWLILVEDAEWLFSNYATQAAREGFSTLDLFGAILGRDGWGGIADRLRGSRSLVMSGDVAKWRRLTNGEPETFARGLGETARMVPMWEASHG